MKKTYRNFETALNEQISNFLLGLRENWGLQRDGKHIPSDNKSFET